MIVAAIDIGGTFTDLIGFDTKARRFCQANSLTIPHDLVQGIVECLDRSGLSPSSIGELIRGSTTAIDTLIERKGARTGLIVTRGMFPIMPTIIAGGKNLKPMRLTRTCSMGASRWRILG